MVTRIERVIVDVDVRGDKELLGLAAAAVAADRGLGQLGKARVGDVAREIDAVGKSARNLDAAGRDIDRFSGRLGIIRDIGLTLGPALIPIGAVAIPALTGLAAQAGTAALAGGTMLTAFQGVGDALTAVNDAALEPTAANLEKARAAMANLGPEARSMVATLQEFRPALRELRDSAAAGLFPGLERAIGDLEGSLPGVERLLFGIGEAAGGVAEEFAEGIAGPRGQEFLAFLRAEMPGALTELGRTVGNFTAGLGELWQAFTPLNRDVSGWLLDASRGFDEWAQGLAQAEGFQDFVAYVRENGPRVADAMTSIGDAALQIVEAMAPLGGPALAALGAVADAVAVIADSPIGTPIAAGAAAFVALNRALQTTQALMGRAGVATTGSGWGGVFGGLGDQAKKATGSVRGFGAALSGSLLTGFDRATMSAEKFTATQRQQASTIRSGLSTIGRGAAGLGAVSLLASGAADDLGLTQTATLGLAGAMAGPFGAAAGATVGALLDIRSASNAAEEAMRAYQTATSAQFRSLTEERAAVSALEEARPGTASGLMQIGFAQLTGGSAGAAKASAELQGFEAAAKGAESRAADLELAAAGLAKGLGVVSTETRNSQISTEDLDAALVRAQPAMSALGISTDDLMASVRDGSFNQLVQQIQNWQARADSAAGRTDTFAKSVADLGNEALSTADSASQMAAALDALLSPQLSLSEATDAWTGALRGLRGDLAKNNKTLTGNTNAALENRSAIRDRVTALTGVLKAEAEAGASAGELSRTLQGQRRALIEAGVAAGLSRKELRGYLNQLGLTPKLVETVIDAVGVEPTKKDIRELQQALNRYGLTRATAQAALRDVASGRIKTVQGLMDKYGITKEQATALLQDKASGRINEVLALLRQIVQPRTARVDAEVGAAMAAIGQVQYKLQQLDGYTARTGVHTVYTASGQRFKEGMAGGGTVPGPRYPYGDSLLVPLAPTEEVTTNRHGEADLFRRELKDINAGLSRGEVWRRMMSRGLADGGTVGRRPEQRAYLPSTGATATHTVERVVERLPREFAVQSDIGPMVLRVVDSRLSDQAASAATASRTTYREPSLD